MRIVHCQGCGHEGAYYIVRITDDYVVIRCPHCHHEQTLPVGMDQE